jgi:hypothetical protein
MKNGWHRVNGWLVSGRPTQHQMIRDNCAPSETNGIQASDS